jgi:hypothetical protein
MIRYSVAVLISAFWVTSAAAAIDCAAEAPSGKGHWSWRTIDGKKCWYQGRPGISKDKLRWPAATVGQNDRRAVDRAPRAAEPEMLDAAQALAQDTAQPQQELTFMDRWRAMIVR